MKKFLAAVIFMLSLSSLVCAANENVPQSEPERNLSTGVNEFCWKYFATLNRNENILYSPYGIHAALSVMANGASGDTRQEILNALGADNVENLNAEHKNFSELVAKSYGENLFAEFNLLLVDKKIFGRGLNENFRRVVTDIYNSDVREADFSDNLDGERDKIKRWVADKTRGFIPNYYALATAETVTDLLNVVCFKGAWAVPFNERDTSLRSFKNYNGSIGEHPIMSKIFENSITYRADEKFKGIELPYSAGAAMYLILPVDENSLNVAELWNAESFSYREDFLVGLKNSTAFDGEVVVRIPKLRMSFEKILVDNLREMGMEKSFGDDAEFFNIVNGKQLKIGNAKHCAEIKIDEQGTEAAAVTEIVTNDGMAIDEKPPRRVYFLAERPFLFVIRDVESNITLFAGVVNDL